MSKNIFVGSASESKSLAMRIQNALKDNGFNPLVWWDQFKNGDNTLQRLLDLTVSADAAVLILSADDKLWSRGHEYDSPRDNCLFELGLFVSKLGARHSYLLTDESIKVPTDYAGITVRRYRRDDEESQNEAIGDIVAHFKALADTNITSGIPPVYSDATVVKAAVDAVLGVYQQDWDARSLYLGEQGATLWGAVANDPSYPLNPNNNVGQIKAAEVRRTALSKVSSQPEVILSLGPGDGRAERGLVQQLAESPGRQWVPVDISTSLVHNAINTLRDDIRIPFGVVADFEDGMSFIKEVVTKSLPSWRTRLFTMLGNTFGNLDRGEVALMDNMRSIMNPGDSFLFDAGLRGGKATPDSESRTQHDGYNEKARRFLCGPLSRRLQVPLEQLAAQMTFRERVSFDIHQVDDPAVSTTIITAQSAQYRILRNRRYTFNSLIDWLKTLTGFALEFSGETYDNKEVTGLGVFVLKRLRN